MKNEMKYRILYIEDDAAMARRVKAALEDLEYYVELASDGAEGLAKYIPGKYDLIAVDNSMPVYSGLEVLSILSNQGTLPPTIMITGKGDERVAVEAMKLGAYDYIVKDVEGYFIELLPAVIEKALDHKQLVIERNQAQYSLEESEKRYRKIFNATADGIYLVDKDSLRIVDANDAALRLYGYTKEEFIGKTVDQLNYLSVEDEQIGHKPSVSRHCRKDGTHFPLELEMSPITHNGREMVIHTVHDLSERLVSEQRLMRLSTAMRTMPDGLIITNLSGKIVDANEAATEIVGMDDKVQLVGRHVQEFVADEHRAGAGELLDSLLNAGEIRDAEFTIKKGEGAPVPIEISVSVVNSATGSPMGYVGVFRNIEHRIAADEQLRVLSETVKQSPVSVVITDRDGIIEYVNPAFMRMTGWDTGDCISSKSFLWNEDDEGYYHDMCKTLAEGKTWRSELMDKRSDGSEYWVHVAISPIYDEHGEVSRYLELREDITKRIRADRELKEAKEAAEIAARIKSEFLANMSHEIRTPMNGIIGMTTLLKDTSLTKEQKNLVDTLRTSGDTLLTIINDILDFSKIEAGHMELEEQPFSVLDCIQDTIDLLAPRAMDKGLDIGYIIEKNTPITIIGDTTRTRQVLVNLVGNAIKFTASGDILISVGAKHLENNKYAMEFSVRDTGIGISEEKVGRIFDSFTQADSSTARKYGGTGLGLAICRRISDMMGGSLSVESELGVGSTFSFSFPTLSKECRQPEFMNGASPHLSGKRLLVADDNPMMLEIVSHYAKMWGMEVAIADSGTGALAMFERNPDVDIAIADKHLPDMDGMQLVADLNVRSDGTVPFILMSPLGRNDSVNDELGVHIVKPIRPTGLYKALVSAFHAQSGDEIEQKEDEMLIDAHFAEKHPLRILLTEDNVVNQMVALNLLERMGYEADLAANGLEAVEAIERQRYDLILMDVQMPEMNGIEATREIIERWSDDRPRIIAMTAYAMESDKEECLEAGMDDYVGKPVKVDELAKALAKCEPRESVEELIEEITMYRAIDFEAVDQFNRDVTNGNGSYLTKLIDIFNGEAEKAINEIREGLQEQDAERIRSAAHSMKSGSGSVGAMHMMDLFARIEREARNESFDPIPTILNELEIEFSIAKENLQEIKARVEPSNGVHA